MPSDGKSPRSGSTHGGSRGFDEASSRVDLQTISSNNSAQAKRARWAARITATWRQAFESIIETGRLLIAAKVDLPHGAFLDMIKADLPFGPSTVQRLMVVARDERLSNTAHGQFLPPSWRTLYELTKLPDEELQARIADGTIHADMQRRDIAVVVKKARRAEREVELGAKQLALPQRRYGHIVADPEWRFESWSRETGMDRAADNHYPTSCTEVIASRNVESIAAEDCVLFLWATVPMLPHALVVMGAWGFDYCSHVAWGKNRAGTGYWVRNKHELLLIGTRGKIPAPAPGDQWDSLIMSPRLKHSEKPLLFLELIERLYPNMPKIELNCRGVPRPGWDAWGNGVKGLNVDI
jgi:N6-adenosine-specific RNA methylase IME4